MAAMIAEDIRHRYRGALACLVPHLSFEPATIHAVMGPSGAGKTTFLRILAGLTAPEGGQVWFRDRPVYGRNGIRRRVRSPVDLREVVMVLQDPHLFSGTVRYNLEYGLKVRGVPSRERTERVERTAGLLGLGNSLSWRSDSLSAGEAQRVALGRALVLRPAVLLLDEPTANLDPANIRGIEEALAQARSRWQTAVIMATHDPSQARRLADYISLFVRGRLERSGPAAEFFDQFGYRWYAASQKGEAM